jgi:hypothetical protein
MLIIMRPSSRESPSHITYTWRLIRARIRESPVEGDLGVLLLCLFWNREECPSLTTLHAVRIHTRWSLDRHDYTHSIELVSSTHPSLDGHCFSCLFMIDSNRKIFIIIMVFLSIQNVVVRVSTIVNLHNITNNSDGFALTGSPTSSVPVTARDNHRDIANFLFGSSLSKFFWTDSSKVLKVRTCNPCLPWLHGKYFGECAVQSRKTRFDQCFPTTRRVWPYNEDGLLIKKKIFSRSMIYSLKVIWRPVDRGRSYLVTPRQW